MPTAPLALCLEPGCPVRVPSGRCRRHAARSPRDHYGTPRRLRGYGPAYERARSQLLGLPCALRLPGCTGVATTADHGPFGLRPACAHCNYADGARKANAARRSLP
jgi:hypothetical protein